MLTLFLDIFSTLKRSTITQKLISYYRNENISTVIKVLSLFSALGTLFTVLSFFIYGIGYTFLYGYYFGRKDASLPSSIEVMTSSIPFNRYVPILIGIFFLISTLFCIYILKIISTMKIANIIGAVFFFFLFHFSISLFFLSRDVGIDNSVQFLTVWLVPVSWAIFIIWYYLQFFKYQFNTLLTTILSFFIISILSKMINETNSYASYLIVYTLLLSSILSVLSTKLSPRITNWLLLLPCVLIGLSLALHLIPRATLIYIPYIIRVCLLFTISIIATILLLKIPHIIRLITRLPTRNKNILDSDSFTSLRKNSYLVNLAALLLLILGVTIIPSMTISAGKQFHSKLPEVDLNYIIFSDQKLEIRGLVIAQDNGVFYISDEKQELVTVKSDEFTSCPSSLIESCRSKSK